MGEEEKTYPLKKKPSEAEVDAILADSRVGEYQGTAEIRCPKE